MKVLVSEVNKLLQIYYTLPVTSATAERTFSVIRKLMNYYEGNNDPEKADQ